MNIILLSGGSGKRLWPLSNDIRSKQFIRLFKNENGDYESMLQRVYRQILAVERSANVTIATSKTQVSTIRNQLGDKVSVCVEPCRKDTFPAIALATAYLRDELGIDREECVAVCPVDPYVDNTYYEAVAKLQKLVQSGKADLTLMGIEPTEPSDKYGYIIPEIDAMCSPVKSFKEKPTVELARAYIEQGALWNAGVFAFKLGYLLDIAHSLIPFKDYKDLYAKYADLDAISFDYAVVEKAKSIQVLRYQGEWKDVGTWSMMTGVMADNVKGNVKMDEQCQNTTVINELDIPVLCMGIKDAIVVVGNDGIFVADKARSEAMKPYVEEVSEEVRVADRSWGSFTVIDVHEDCKTTKFTVKAGFKRSCHTVEHWEKVWTVVSGTGKAVVNGEDKLLKTGAVVTIPEGAEHSIEAYTALAIIEVQIWQK